MIVAAFSFTYPSSARSADKMLDDVEALLADYELQPGVVHGITLSVSEAFTNAVVHGNKFDPAKVVYIEFTVNDFEVIADISDQGSGGMELIESRKPSTQLSDSGRGVDLMKHYADECRFSEVEGGGLKVSLVFQREKKENVVQLSSIRRK